MVPETMDTENKPLEPRKSELGMSLLIRRVCHVAIKALHWSQRTRLSTAGCQMNTDKLSKQEVNQPNTRNICADFWGKQYSKFKAII